MVRVPLTIWTYIEISNRSFRYIRLHRHHTADEEKWGLNRSLVTYIESPRISPTDIVTGRATLREAERDAGKRLQRKRILLFNVED